MSSTRSSQRWPTAACSLLFLMLLKSIAVYGATITVNAGDKIQDALDEVQPGDTIEIESGEYYEDIRTRVDGTADQRITITAAGGSSNRDNVIIRGGGDLRVFEINHDYYTVEGFTIDGETFETVGDDDYERAFRDKLIYATGIQEPTMRDGGYLSALDGLIIRDMTIKNAGGECVRLRYFVTFAKIYDNDVDKCGLYDFLYDAGGKNGEGIYIGTSNNQWDDGKNPTNEPDVCMGNHVRDNNIQTEGNEGVEVKEGSIDNLIEDNAIYMQLDADSGGIGSRGDRTIIRNNYIEDASGAGIRLGGAEVDGYQYGVDNEVYGNVMVDCRAYGVKIMVSPQGQICGNDIELPDDQDDDDYAYSGGTYGDDYDPREDCDSNPGPSPTPSPTPSTPSPTPSTPSPTYPTPSPTDIEIPEPSSTPSPTAVTPSPTSEEVTPNPVTPSPTSPTPSPTITTNDTPSPVATPSPSTREFPQTRSPTSPAPTVRTPSPVEPTKYPPSPVATPSPSSPEIPQTPSPTSPAPTVHKPSPEIPTEDTPSPVTPSPSSKSPPSSPAPTAPTPSPARPTIHTLFPTGNYGTDDSGGDDSWSTDEYVGCFVDDHDYRPVTFAYRDFEGMTNENCIEHCRDEGSRFAGTSRGHVCGCANSSERISRNGESRECLMECSGDDSEECGGYRAVSIWKV